ncbi:Peroxisomal carnitine O-octanoyltransferase [Toxocara canis]|uniref:Peroxisomal carnitine O-octanoyltransferase n=1 Tax=Toxocara canis TaxID=6265 RepID=A0A0B2VI13_TOXCA|nr:Peroxisomal carnitine O-octanoyltransferase [Toxocara canis]
MHQYYNMFNAARIPARPKDVIRRFFCTEKEGASSSEVLVLCRGNIWIIETMPNNEVLSPDIFLHQLTFIDHQSKRCRSSPIPLTTLQRDKWADMRLRLISLSESNAVNLARIEQTMFVISLTEETFNSADDMRLRLISLSESNAVNLARIEQTMFVISLTEETFNSADDVISYGLVGCADAQWVDKSMNFFFHKDGRMGTQAEHSNVDAIVILDASDLSSKVSRKDIWQPEEADYAKPTKLEFAMDNSLAAAVDEAERAFAQLRTTLAGMSVSFELFGNERFKASKVYGDTIIQMALQLAFYRTHGKLAPAYETASTRQFFHGRTETVRSCTAPLAKLVRLIVDDHAEACHDGWGAIPTGNVIADANYLGSTGDMIMENILDSTQRREAFNKLASAAKSDGVVVMVQLSHGGR